VYNWIAEKGSSPLFFIVTFLVTAILVGCVLYAALSIYTRFIALHTQQERKAMVHPITITLTPLLFLYLTSLEHFVYLRDIHAALLLASVLGTAYLQYSLWERLNKNNSQDSALVKKREPSHQPTLRSKKTSRIVLILSISIYILYASGVIFPPHPITGDEPHYLLITHSLLLDGDINLFNNYRDNDYLQFYPGELESHTFSGKKGLEYQYSKHTPGLPVLLVPSYVIGKKLGRIVSDLTHNPSHQQQILILTLRVSMGLLSALLCWIFFLFARSFTKNQSAALLSWFIFATTSPFFIYSQLIYPEIPASLIILGILYHVVSLKNISSSTVLWISLGIAILPWLGAKYIILSAGLFLMVIYGLWKSGRTRREYIFLFFAPLFLSAGFFLFYLWMLYGNIWPQSLYVGSLPSGSSLSVPVFHLNASEFIRCGLSYLFDQRIGFLPYSPIYMIAIPGIFLSIAHKKRQSLPPLGIFLLYWSFCSMSYYWGGYCPPGRTLLPVMCILALFLAGAMAWGKNRYSIAVQRALLFLSLGIVFLCAREPRILYHEALSTRGIPSGTFSNLLKSLSNSIVNLQVAAPSLINITNVLWTPLIFWFVALALICMVFLKKEKKTIPAFMDLKKPVLAVFLFSTLLLAYTFFDIHLDRAHTFKNKTYTLYFQDSNNYGQELEGFWTRGRLASEVLLETNAGASEIRVRLSSPVPGKATIRVGREKQSVSRGRTEGQEKTLAFTSPVGFQWKDGYLYSIRVKEGIGFHPHRLDPRVQDNRFLGVFVRIDVEVNEK
jgi:hypothetical protein